MNIYSFIINSEFMNVLCLQKHTLFNGAPTSTGRTIHYLHFEQTKLSGIECGFTPTHSQ